MYNKEVKPDKELFQSDENSKGKYNEVPSEQNFEKYLNEQIGHMLFNDLNGTRKIHEAIQSPILLPRNMSQKSVDSSFYDP